MRLNHWIARIILVFMVGSFAAMPTIAQAPWPLPGQSGNTVGYAGYGSLTVTSCGSLPAGGSSWTTATRVHDCTFAAAPTVSDNYYIFERVDFNGGTGSCQINGSHILFIGSRCQSNRVAVGAWAATGADVYWMFPSVTPLASLYTSPPGYTWPSAGAGANSLTITEGTNAINGNNGYEYGWDLTGAGPYYIDSYDAWGFGDCVVLPSGTTAQITITNGQCHDIANPTEQGYHTDGVGYSNEAAGPSNVTIIGNVGAMLGNTNSLAMQGVTSAYNNLRIDYNFFSGNNATIAFCHGSPGCTNSSFYGNIWGSDVMDCGIADAGNFLGSGSTWAYNTIYVRPGTTWTNGNSPCSGSNYTPASGDNGKFIYPTTNNANATDYSSNTVLISLYPPTLHWVPGTSSTQTVTLKNNGSGSDTISSVSMKTGTFFSQSNTCGGSVASGSTCTFTVTYNPTGGSGPLVDEVHITDSSPGASSPHIIPLIGYGTPAFGASFTCSPSAVPANHSNNIAVACTGSGTSWTGSTAFSVSGVSGATLVSKSNSSSTAETLQITTGSGTGTLTITDTTDSISTTIAVATATLAIAPTVGNVSTTPTLTLIGTNTLWTTETASTLLSVSGGSCSGESIATPTVTSNTAATAVLTTGSAACPITVTDNSTTASATFTVRNVAIAPATIPAHHSGHISLTLTGSGTSWTGSTTFTPSGVAGVSVISQTNTSGTLETVVVTTGSGTGTLTITGSDGSNGTVAVAAATLAVSPSSGFTGASPAILLTGTNTLWSSETPSTLFTVTGVGCSGESLGVPSVSSNTAATDNLTTGTLACTETITDNSTTATATFVVTSAGNFIIGPGTAIIAANPAQVDSNSGGRK